MLKKDALIWIGVIVLSILLGTGLGITLGEFIDYLVESKQC